MSYFFFLNKIPRNCHLNDYFPLNNLSKEVHPLVQIKCSSGYLIEYENTDYIRRIWVKRHIFQKRKVLTVLG